MTLEQILHMVIVHEPIDMKKDLFEQFTYEKKSATNHIPTSGQSSLPLYYDGSNTENLTQYMTY